MESGFVHIKNNGDSDEFGGRIVAMITNNCYFNTYFGENVFYGYLSPGINNGYNELCREFNIFLPAKGGISSNNAMTIKNLNNKNPLFMRLANKEEIENIKNRVLNDEWFLEYTNKSETLSIITKNSDL